MAEGGGKAIAVADGAHALVGHAAESEEEEAGGEGGAVGGGEGEVVSLEF